MTAIAAERGRVSAPWIFAFAAFLSAALVFAVEPMIGRMALPLLGGSAGVWAASLVFFQAALLVGYLYAHALQHVASMRTQVLVHLAVLVAAGLTLPLHLSRGFGEPPATAPSFWLLGVLTLTVGPPFAALSATAPLIQVWRGESSDEGPWSLYAASNLGSLVALLAYPTLIEPAIGLSRQRIAWSWGYGVFILVMAGAGAAAWSGRAAAGVPARATASGVGWADRARWIALAAVPSALLIGVTNALSADVGSAPFLWVAPLSLYLITFVIAFRGKGPLAPESVLVFHAIAIVTACSLMQPFLPGVFLVWVVVQMAAFFLSALVCHQALVARRPAVAGLTDFYLCLSLGGVVGGVLSALLAPVLFRTVVEYPAALALSCLARPWGMRLSRRLWPWLVLIGAGALLAVAAVVNHPVGPAEAWIARASVPTRFALVLVLTALAGIAVLVLQDRAVFFAAAAVVLLVGDGAAKSGVDVIARWRNFYGTLHVSRVVSPGLGGEVRKLANGSTLHGAEAVSPAYRCQPIAYYAHETPIGQLLDVERRRGPLNVGVVGLGAGTIAAYARPQDRFTFFEINPLVVRIARNPAWFHYVSDCARSPVRFVIGDARRRIVEEPNGWFDVLIVDAFSSDSVPSHLLTVEAARLYLSKVKPDGVVLLHLSNRHLDLMRPAQALGQAVGAVTLKQEHREDRRLPYLWDSSEDVVLLAPSPSGAAPFLADSRWAKGDPEGVAPWTDDRIDVFGAFARRLSGR